MQRSVLRLLIIVMTLVLWEILVLRTGQLTRYPHPMGMAAAAVRTISNHTLIAATWQSLTRVLTGFCIATTLGIVTGALVGLSRSVDRGLTPILEVLRSIAPIAWISVAILWFGITGQASIFVVAYAAFFPVVLNTAQAVQFVDAIHIRAARTLGAGSALLLRAVVLPSALPTILVGARIAMGLAWGTIIAAELAMGSKLEGREEAVRVGLGQLMINTLFIQRDINALALYMLVVGVMGLAIDNVIRLLRRFLCAWIT